MSYRNAALGSRKSWDIARVIASKNFSNLSFRLLLPGSGRYLDYIYLEILLDSDSDRAELPNLDFLSSVEN